MVFTTSNEFDILYFTELKKLKLFYFIRSIAIKNNNKNFGFIMVYFKVLR